MDTFDNINVTGTAPNQACPSCGYCRHCGRGGNPHVYPIYPVQPFPWTTTGVAPLTVGDNVAPLTVGVQQ